MKLSGYRYSIAFSVPLQNSTTTYSHRKGLILRLTTDQHQFFAESAPLPGFSSYTIDDAINQMQDLSPKLRNILSSGHPTKQLQQLYSNQEVYPTNEFALDTLAYQKESHSLGVSLCDHLFEQPHTQLPVNAVVSLISPDTKKEIENILAQGYNTVKVKIGTDFKQEYDRLKEIRSRYPKLKIRADANRAWALEEAIENCQKLQELDTEYCEEPLKNPSENSYRKLNQQSKLPLAIDESILKCNHWQKLLPHTSFVILKPMILGTLSRIFNINKHIKYNGNKTIITTSLGTAIGRMITSVICLGTGSQNHAHGLATADILANNLQDDRFLIDGMIKKSEMSSYIKVPKNKLDSFLRYNFF